MMENLFKIEKVYTIQELNGTVRKLIRDQFPGYVWVCGEIQDLRDRGTINLNLVQKHTEANEIIAQAKAVIFENVRPQIDRRIKETSGAFEFRKDIEVKLLCKVDLYIKTGQFSLTVFDIDPVYTLGKMAQSRQKIIEELRAKGLFEKNKLIPMPLIPLKVGLITSPDSAAYHDVIDEFKKSKYGFNIFVWESYMQGKLVENDVLAALNFFNNLSFDELDVIMIARGGGSTADLSWFDNKKIAEAIAFLKFPLISAIGHEINTSITDMVAHTFVKTPTKGAQFLVERIKNFLDSLTDFEQRTQAYAQDLLEDSKNALETIAVKIDSAVPRYLRFHKEELVSKKETVSNFTKRFLELKSNQLSNNVSLLRLHLNKIFKCVVDDISHKESKIRLLDPHNVLKRGYSITFKADKAIKSIDDIGENDMIKTVLYQGNIVSEVKEKQKSDE